ncbi:MAG: glycosyltransferase family 4 protein [Parvularculaceae bacterium]
MTADAPRTFRICHLGPETPGLSLTFVYREAAALKRRGHDVTVVSVRRPIHLATDADIGPVATLYDEPKSALVGSFVRAFAGDPAAFAATLALAVRDVAASAAQGRFAPALLWHWFMGLHLARLMVDRRIEHCHVHFAHFPAQIALYAGRYAGVPVTITAHANDIHQAGLLLKEKGERAAAIATISEFNADHLARRGVDREKLPIVRCWAPLPSRRAPAPPARPLRIGWLWRRVEKKGVATAVRTVGILKERGFDVVFEIVGDGPERARIEAAVASLGAGDVVKLLGAMPNSAAQSWLRSLHLFAMACQEDRNGDVDGVPVAMMEAMAVGVPVASTRVSGVPELVIDGETGVLAPPEDPAAFADAIERCVRDAALYERLRRGAEARVATEFSEEVNVGRLEKLITDVQTRRARP